jgi:predicted RNA methylase
MVPALGAGSGLLAVIAAIAAVVVAALALPL